MLCPKCKNEMKEGMLYCENCGEEINIVPEFESSLEHELQKTLNSVASDLKNEMNESHKTQITTEENFMDDDHFFSRFLLKFIKQKLSLFIMIALFFCICIVVIWFYSLSLHRNSFEYQYGQALYSAKEGNYKNAIEYMKKAISLNEAEHSAKLSLAEYYNVVNKEEEAILILNDLIDQDINLEQAYKQLFEIYEESSNYAIINLLLMKEEDPLIKELYHDYLSESPEFSVRAGTYDEVVELKLSSNNQGNIYYTLDGSKPTIDSPLYQEPLNLENGVYRVSAIYVNKYMVESEIETKVYTIDTTVPHAPEVLNQDGAYSDPQMIVVETPPNGDVFYTLDGSEPNIESNHYSYPFPMPIGSNILKFVTINYQGVKSDVTIRNFNLNMEREITPAQAVNSLVMELTNRGYLLDYNGYVAGLEGRNAYIMTSAIRIDGEDFYLIYEKYEDVDGSMTETGNVFAVNTTTNEFYKYNLKANGNYWVTPF
jgi:tetratricopeptide (TPR) repeat protein